MALSRREPITLCHPVVAKLIAGLHQDDIETAEHSDRMAALVGILAERSGLEPEEVELARVATFLHDIGKLEIPWHLLNKTTPLTEGEQQLVRLHPVVGYQILMRFPELAKVARIIRHHHERFDGTGYPDKLAGHKIPHASRIITVVDALEAMTSPRPYRPAHDLDYAHQELVRCRGSQFDPEIVDIVLHMFDHERPLLEATFRA